MRIKWPRADEREARRHARLMAELRRQFLATSPGRVIEWGAVIVIMWDPLTVFWPGPGEVDITPPLTDEQLERIAVRLYCRSSPPASTP